MPRGTLGVDYDEGLVFDAVPAGTCSRAHGSVLGVGTGFGGAWIQVWVIETRVEKCAWKEDRRTGGGHE